MEVYVLSEGRYQRPALKFVGDTLEPAGLPGLKVAATEALAIEPAGQATSGSPPPPPKPD